MSTSIHSFNKPFIFCLAQKGWKEFQSKGVQETLSNVISELTRPIFFAFQNVSFFQKKDLPKIEKGNENLKKILLKENEKILSYLNFSEKAPPGDWVNEPIIFNGFSLTPLNIVCHYPKAICQNGFDPFFQLLEKGADPYSNTPATLELICALSILSEAKYLNISVARAKKLLHMGISVPKVPGVQAWLRLHCRDELRNIAPQQLDTQLPANWSLPNWIPPIKKLSMPSSTAQGVISSNISMDWISKHREKLRPIGEVFSEHPILTSCYSLGIYSLVCMLNYYLTNTVHIPALATAILLGGMPVAIETGSPLNKWDMKKLHMKALQNPLYAELWQRVDPSTKLIFEPLNFFLKQNLTKDRVSLANYNSKMKRINIYQGLTEVRALHMLVFESANADQSSSFNVITNKLLQGYLEREEYVRLVEYIEFRTTYLHQQILDFGYEHLGWEKDPQTTFDPYVIKNWEFAWELANIRSDPNTPDAHSDSYRLHWDQCAFLYYLRNPDKAPTFDWINTSPKFAAAPLQFLAKQPEIGILWEEDPFLQLINKGANLQSNLLKLVVQSATDSNRTAEERKVQAQRAKKLLQKGMRKNWWLSSKEAEWLDSL